jgi:hypothetical protein
MTSTRPGCRVRMASPRRGWGPLYAKYVVIESTLAAPAQACALPNQYV